MRKIPMLALASLCCGCGTTWTRDAGGIPRERLAELLVPSHTGVHDHRAGMDRLEYHVNGVKIDRVLYSLGAGDEVFLVVPGEHQVEALYGRCTHWPETWFAPSVRFLGPEGHASFTAAPGARYVFRCRHVPETGDPFSPDPRPDAHRHYVEPLAPPHEINHERR